MEVLRGVVDDASDLQDFAAGAGIGAAWRETLGRNFPPSTLLYISGLVDERAKVEIEVTAFVPAG